MSAPSVLTAPELTQRSAAPVCLIQSEEILRVRTPAYSKTNSDISFMIRQPSASAILVNDVELLLECKFTLSDAYRAKGKVTGGLANAGAKYKDTASAASDYGFVPEMLPLQNKCIRNAVITINGSSQSQRMNEFGKEYCLLHANRDYMDKIGGGINDYSKPLVMAFAVAGQGAKQSYCENKTAEMQHKRWLLQMLQDHTDADSLAAGTVTPTFQWQEKLFMGPFGAFQQCESYPAWSCESQKSPGLLHIHNMQLQFAMEERWWNSMYLQTHHQKAQYGMAQVVSVEITKAELHTRWCLPPPRMISAALTQQVSYATYDVLRFQADHNGAGLVQDGESTSFKLNAVSFPYMPSLFVFSIAPHYGHATPYIGSSVTDSACLQAMKGDKRCCITHINLSINTSSAAIQYDGEQTVQSARINSRDLYRMTVENCASYEKFPYTYEQWAEHCGVVAVTPGQLSGVLNSPNIRGSVVLQGTVFCKNMMGHPMNASRLDQPLANGDALNGVVFVNQANVPRYQCIVSGFYTNRALVLDSKSGILNEATFSAAFQQSLRMGGSA
jgi:hypothetical protein